MRKKPINPKITADIRADLVAHLNTWILDNCESIDTWFPDNLADAMADAALAPIKACMRFSKQAKEDGWFDTPNF